MWNVQAHFVSELHISSILEHFQVCIVSCVCTYLKINPVTYLSYMTRLLLKSVNYTKERVEKLDEIIQIERTSIEYFAITIPKVSKIEIIQFSL